MPIDRQADGRRDGAHLGDRDRPHRRPGEPAVAGGDPGLRRRRVDRARLQRVDQRDRVGPALLGRDRDRRRVGDVRASASRSAASRSAAAALPAAPPSRPAARRRSGRSGRWDRRRSARSRRPRPAPPTPSTRRANSSRLVAHHRDDQRHRQLRQAAAGPRPGSLQALVRQADRVDHPGRRLPDPLRLVAGPRLGRDRLARRTRRTGSPPRAASP